MNADRIIQDLGEKIKQLTISEAILKGQLVEAQQEINVLNNIINEKDMKIAELQTSQCQCDDDGYKCQND